jgi:hypothetical protein
LAGWAFVAHLTRANPANLDKQGNSMKIASKEKISVGIPQRPMLMWETPGDEGALEVDEVDAGVLLNHVSGFFYLVKGDEHEEKKPEKKVSNNRKIVEKETEEETKTAEEE